MTSQHALFLPVLLPLFLGIYYWLLKPKNALTFRVLSFLVALSPLPLLGYLYAQGSISSAAGGWAPPLGIRLAADGLSGLFLIFHSIVILSIAWNASAEYDDRENPDATQLPFLLMIAWSALNALTLSRDLFNLYVLLELLSVVSVGMILLSRTRPAIEAAVRYLLLAVVAGLLYLLGTGLIYATTGSVDLYLAAQKLQVDPLRSTAVVFIFMGLIIKSALFPVHTWLPPAHANARAPVSALLSGLLVTAAYLVILRLWTTGLHYSTPELLPELLGALGIVSIVWGGIMAMKQNKLKRILAYSTVSQTGYLFLVFALQGEGTPAAAGMWAGTVALALGHGLSKAAAFLSAGMIMTVVGSDNLSDLKGLAQKHPVTVALFAIASANLMALPPGLGFFGKWLLLKASFDQGEWIIAGAVIAGGVLAVGYLMRPLECMLRSHDHDESPQPEPMVWKKSVTWPIFLLAIAPFLVSWGFTSEHSLLRVGAPFEIPPLTQSVDQP